MSAFIPTPGTLFYARSRLVFSHASGEGETATVIKQADRSYHSAVMRCKAADDYSVVAEVVHGDTYGKGSHMLLLHEFNFHPVGPDVAAALGLVP